VTVEVMDGETGFASPTEALEERPQIARMGIAVLALVGLLIAAYLTLFKLGFMGAIQCSSGLLREGAGVPRYA
jgi:hypothetical protein